MQVEKNEAAPKDQAGAELIRGSHSLHRKPLCVALSLALLVCSCAAPGGGGTGTSGQSVEQACSPFVIGAIAAAGCGLLVKGNDRIRAAAACAAAAAVGCYLVNSYQAKQTKTSQEVEDEYKKANRGNLPESATLNSYRSSVTPANPKRGDKVQVASTMQVVPGRQDSSVKVEQELSVVDSVGEVWGKPVRKIANESGQGGEFQTNFTIPIGDGMSQGTYTLQQAVYVNGRVVRQSKDARFNVVRTEEGTLIALLRQGSTGANLLEAASGSTNH